MSDCIFGIKCNGVSISVSQISIDEDQAKFDYICNVSLKDSYNGNGTYDISIINKDYIQGMPVGKWRIKEAWISYDWGDSYAQLIMEDEDGNETCKITADDQKGSASGFHVASLARTVFTKAQEIVRDYPNAKILNAVTDLNCSKKKLNVDFLKKCLNSEGKDDEKYLDDVEYVLNKISTHLGIFKKTKELLQEQDDQRSKQLLKDVSSECKHLLDSLK